MKGKWNNRRLWIRNTNKWDRLAAKKKTQGLKGNIKIAKLGGNVAAVARKTLETELGEKIITKNNNLNYEYKKENLIESWKNSFFFI